MPKGITENRVRDAQVTEAQLDEVFARSLYKKSTQNALKAVFLQNHSYQQAGEPYGLSRQFVFRRAKEVLKRAGISTGIPPEVGGEPYIPAKPCV